MTRAFIASLIVTVLAACAAGSGGLSESDILSQAPFVNEAKGGGPPARFPDALSAEEARGRLEAAREAYLREDFDECLATVRDCLSRGVPADVDRELRTLQYDAKRRLVNRKVLRARALPVRDVVAMGEPGEVDLLLRNLAPVEVRIPRTVGDSSPSSFFLDVVRQDWDVYGNVRSESRKETLPLAEDVVLPPGGEKRIRWSVETPEPERRHLGFTILRVGGVLHPAGITVGSEPLYAGVELETGEVRAFPPGFEPLAADPLASLGKAWRLGAREHLLVAAGLVAPADRDRAVGELVSFLGEDRSPATVTVMGALRLLTGLSFANRPEGWIEWWQGRDGREGSR